MTCELCKALREREDDPNDASLCMRCLGQENGWKCDSCGSPWIYMCVDGSHYDDGEERKLCRPCTYMLINNKGLNRDADDID